MTMIIKLSEATTVGSIEVLVSNMNHSWEDKSVALETIAFDKEAGKVYEFKLSEGHHHTDVYSIESNKNLQVVEFAYEQQMKESREFTERQAIISEMGREIIGD